MRTRRLTRCIRRGLLPRVLRLQRGAPDRGAQAHPGVPAGKRPRLQNPQIFVYLGLCRHHLAAVGHGTAAHGKDQIHMVPYMHNLPPMAGESCIWGMSIMKTLFQIFSSQNPAASCQRTSPVGDQQQCLSCIGSLQRMEQFLFMKGI